MPFERIDTLPGRIEIDAGPVAVPEIRRDRGRPPGIGGLDAANLLRKHGRHRAGDARRRDARPEKPAATLAGSEGAHFFDLELGPAPSFRHFELGAGTDLGAHSFELGLVDGVEPRLLLTQGPLLREQPLSLLSCGAFSVRSRSPFSLLDPKATLGVGGFARATIVGEPLSFQCFDLLQRKQERVFFGVSHGLAGVRAGRSRFGAGTTFERPTHDPARFLGDTSLARGLHLDRCVLNASSRLELETASKTPSAGSSRAGDATVDFTVLPQKDSDRPRNIAPPRRTHPARRALSLVLLAGGLGFVGRAVAATGPHEIWADCRRAGPYIVLVFLAPFVGHFLHSLGWRLLLPSDARPSVARAYRIFLAAQAGNEIGLGLLGEPLKVTELAPAHRSAAVAAVVMDNATAAVALVLFFASGLALSDVVPWSAGHVLATAAAVVGVVLAIGTALARRRSPPPASRVTGGVRRWKFAAQVERTLGVCREAVVSRPRDLLAATALHYVGKLWIIAEFTLILGLLGAGSAHTGALFGVASAAGAAVGAPVPGQVGVLESAILQAAALAGVGVSTALAVALIRRVRGCFWVLVGVLGLPARR